MTMKIVSFGAPETFQGRGGGDYNNRYRDFMKNELDLPKGSEEPTPVVFVPASYAIPNSTETTSRYDTFMHMRVVKSGAKVDFIADAVCSMGNDPYNPQPCAGCSAAAEGDPSMGQRKSAHFFNVVSLANYHAIPIFKKSGEPVLEADGSVKVEWQRCGGMSVCNVCRQQAGGPLIDNWLKERVQRAGANIQTQFGRLRFLKVGPGHNKAIDNINKEIQSMCPTCLQPGVVGAYRCGYCNHTLLDLNTTTVPPKDREELLKRPYPCTTCQRPVMLIPQGTCRTCGPISPDAQMGIADGVVFLKKSGSGKDTTIAKTHFFKFEQFEAYINQNPAFLAGRTLQDLISSLSTPFDFPTELAPLSADEQRAILYPQRGGNRGPSGGPSGPGFGRQQQMPPMQGPGQFSAPAPQFAPPAPFAQYPQGVPPFGTPTRR